ncbi:nitroreductase family protein [Trichomonas vaginalis G3]|uniref:Nitroreductase family protein n=1 Tax=Trichomonas vaginalis (strain ATCC PRA-98 / G3) TaxID=412133 RepID=A2EIQ8_TRIV3|nr:nitroreductase family [Trichomonas vaginalis G3]EAY07485.1 nitroreductase family protein [Trichomonas vaginalis G3]KAI5487819.1 nitroreductase family [Trichomonas vaginalis G3]|eukprot:XP_001319708.1 nitroreductase family protein [Trichomonas vaginalis G3]
MSSEQASHMSFYEAVEKRRMVCDFQDKEVPEAVLKRIIDAGLKAPTYDHLRNWEFIIVKDPKDKKHALQFIEQSTPAQLKILEETLSKGSAQEKMYSIAMPRQYSMLYNASYIVFPFFKSTPDLMHPTCVSSLNPISSIWCVIENIFLAATAEGLACSMRIPVGEEGPNVAKAIGAPDDYLLPCYLGIGYPLEDRPKIEQIQFTAEQKVHYGKW